MMKILRHLRDFMDADTVKGLLGDFQADTFILLRQFKADKNGVHRHVVQVFDKRGTWIGEISNPDWIPKQK